MLAAESRVHAVTNMAYIADDVFAVADTQLDVADFPPLPGECHVEPVGGRITTHRITRIALRQHKFKLAVDGKLIGKETELTVDDVKDYRFTAALKAGERKVSIEFTNDTYKENEYDRNLYIHGLTLKRVK